MRILIVHTERTYLGGAEKMLAYYADELLRQNREFAIALTPASRLDEILPPEAQRIYIPDNQQFSLLQLWRQAKSIVAARSAFPFDLVHGWMARSWELAGLVGWLSRRPAVGTLHDHPHAGFISPKRRLLMLWAARLGLTRVICVSHAVRDACVMAGYPAGKLSVVHNGLPANDGGQVGKRPINQDFHFGFLGVFSKRKGIDHLLQILDEFAGISTRPWTLSVAGGTQDTGGQSLLDKLHHEYSSRPWWPRVRWVGWCGNPLDFLRSLDLLIVPSSDFDPLPTVILEAGLVETPVLAARVGGVSEIVVHEQTGWLYNPGDFNGTVQLMRKLVEAPEVCRRAGARASQRIRDEFSLNKMLVNHERSYRSLTPP